MCLLSPNIDKMEEIMEISSWDDYWKRFDLLIKKLEREGFGYVVNELMDAQKYVNGLTDGWSEFKVAIENILESYRSKMTVEQIDILTELIEILNKSLTDRN